MARTKRYANKDDAERADTRRRALALRKIESPAAIAQLLGVHPSTVGRWFAAADERGPTAVTTPESIGRKRALTDDQVNGLIALLKKSPSKHGIDLKRDTWTWEAITSLANQRFSTDCVRQTIQSTLRRAGWEINPDGS